MQGKDKRYIKVKSYKVVQKDRRLEGRHEKVIQCKLIVVEKIKSSKQLKKVNIYRMKKGRSKKGKKEKMI